MNDLINTKAKEIFGINYVFPYQRLVISNTLKSCGYYGEEEKIESLKNQIVILPTGAGKSLCFMLPGLILDGVTLIIFPLLSLMADQERRIVDSGGKALVLKGGVKIPNSVENDIKFILTNPETLSSKKVLKLLLGVVLSQVVIDETHTVSQWGESFRPSYLEVGKHLKTIGAEVITAYTATASDYIISSVIENIFLKGSVNVIKGNPDRINIYYEALPCLNKDEALIDLLRRVETPAIILHKSRVSTEVINRMLVNRLNRDDIVYYHAGLESSEKQAIEEWFFESNTGILNATCAYGMA